MLPGGGRERGGSLLPVRRGTARLAIESRVSPTPAPVARTPPRPPTCKRVGKDGGGGKELFFRGPVRGSAMRARAGRPLDAEVEAASEVDHIGEEIVEAPGLPRR